MLDKKDYYFYILAGVHSEYFRKVRFADFGIQVCELHSKAFTKIMAQLENADLHLHELMAHTKKGISKSSFVLISEKEEDLIRVTEFLTMIQASKLRKMASFGTRFTAMDVNGTNVEERNISSLTIYSYSIIFFNADREKYKEYNLFMIAKHEVQKTNKLMSLFMTTKLPDSFKKLAGIYHEAYKENTDYVKYLLFMMFIESLVVDNATVGVGYKIARMCGVLTGDTKDKAGDIFSDMKKAYNIRSKLVHSAANELHKGNYLLFTHAIVSELICTIILNGFETNNLFSKTTAMGFGDQVQFSRQHKLKSFLCYFTNEMILGTGLKKSSPN
jgi:hypothetical protein